MPRVAFLTNMIPPYHKPVFDALSKRYEHVRILLSTPMESNRPWKPAWDGLDVVVQKTMTFKRRWKHPHGFGEDLDLHLPLDTLQQLRRFHPDVVISWEMGARTSLAILYRHLHRECRLIVWAEVAESTEQGRGWMRETVRRFLPRSVDAFLVTGESGARYIRSLGVNDDKIFKIAYTTDVSRFSAIPLARSEERAKRLLYVGQLVERKGVAQFIKVLSKWSTDNSDCKIEFVLAGDGPLRARLEHISIAPHVKLTFLGNIRYEDLPNLYSEAGIFVLPTLADTWGVVVNEAMAAGLPVMGSIYSQAVTEIVKEGKNGWTFRADDANEMYDALDRSMRTPIEELNKMRECARDTATRLTPDYVAGLVAAAVTACWKDMA